MPELIQKIRTIVVDDEEVSLQALSQLISQHPKFVVVSECGDGKTAISKILELRPDVVFLDIQMPEISGFDVLDAINNYFIPIIVFVTAHDQFAIKAFDVHAIDYILKPYSQQRLTTALERVHQLLYEREDNSYKDKILALMHSDLLASFNKDPKSDITRVMIQNSGEILFLDLRDIIWFEGADYFVKIHTQDRVYLHRESLKKIESKLGGKDFFRIHNSIIVNLAYVEKIAENESGKLVAILKNHQQLRVSQRRKKELLNLGTSKFGFGE